MKEKLIVALDVNTRDDALHLVDQLREHVGLFKVGLELFTACGPDIVREIGGSQVFLDLKFHDIPNTAAGAARSATQLGVRMFNVHAMGGMEMMMRAKQASLEVASDINIESPIVLGVTLLTSLDESAAAEQLRVTDPLQDYVAHLAKMARLSQLDGVVCSPREIALVRNECGPGFVIVTPGVRPASAGSDVVGDDQKRVMTPAEAVASGADYLVIGRPITRADNPAAAALRIVEDMGVLE